MEYPNDFADPRHKFIGSQEIDMEADTVFIDYNGKRVTVGGADSWPWGGPEFAAMLKAAGLEKRKGQTLINIKGRTGKYVR
jgi:hypothetical protein